MIQGALVKSLISPLAYAAAALVSLSTATTPASASPSVFEPSVEAWSRDIDTIVQDALTVHPNAFTKIGRSAFLQRAEELKRSLRDLSQEQRVVRAMQLVASVGDGHTQLETNNPRWGIWYPIRTYQFTDGYFITGALQPVQELVGAQILEVHGKPVEEAAEAARTLFGADNDSGARNNLFALSDAVLMRGLGLAEPDGSLRLRLRLRSGRTVERRVSPRAADGEGWEGDLATFEWRFRHEMAGPPLGKSADWIGAFRNLAYPAYRTADKTRPPHLAARVPFFSQQLTAGDAYYIQVNLITGSGEEGFVESFKRALREVDQLKPRRLIIDIRYNIGGDGSKVPAMIHEFVKREDNPPWRELYLLTGRRSFSAAVMMADAFMEHTDASIVGEPAGAGLNHFGDATNIGLPATGLSLHMSTLWHQLGRSSDRLPVITVDAAAEFSFAEYAAGADPAVDAILAGKEMRSIGIIALAKGAAAAWRVYQERKGGGATPRWVEPREVELARMAWRLYNLGRKDDARELFRLRAEAFPNSAKAWYELGNVQLGADQKAAALESYRRSLAIDPNNVDNADARATLAKN